MSADDERLQPAFYLSAGYNEDPIVRQSAKEVLDRLAIGTIQKPNAPLALHIMSSRLELRFCCRTQDGRRLLFKTRDECCAHQRRPHCTSLLYNINVDHAGRGYT